MPGVSGTLFFVELTCRLDKGDQPDAPAVRHNSNHVLQLRSKYRSAKINLVPAPKSGIVKKRRGAGLKKG